MIRNVEQGTRLARARRGVVVLVAALAVAVSGCTSDKSFGGGAKLNFGSQPPTPTPTIEKKETKPPKKGQKRETRKAAKKPKTTEFELEIQGGQCGLGLCGYDPQRFAVRRGTKIVVINKSDQERSWTADDGRSFDSGMIKPGGRFEFIADLAPGSYGFHDEVAQYAIGEMVVQ